MREGKLTAETRTTLTFSRGAEVTGPRAALFEDGIILGRLRGRLKNVPGLPESVAGSATVHDTLAYLKLADVPGVETAALAIDAALKTRGVAGVYAVVVGPTQL